MSLACNKNGQVLLEYFKMKEHDILQYLYHPISHIMIFIKCQGEFLLRYHSEKHVFEFPQGILEFDESLRQCARRSLYEQSNQVVYELDFLGIFRILDTRVNRFKYCFAYYSEIDELNPVQDEVDIRLWDVKEEIEKLDEIEIKMLQLIIKGGS